MVERCPKCGLRFERIEGHWSGAIGINTVLSFILLLAGLVACLVAMFAPDPNRSAAPFTIGLMIFAGTVPALLFPISRTLWTAIDVLMRPLELSEVSDESEVSPQLFAHNKTK